MMPRHRGLSAVPVRATLHQRDRMQGRGFEPLMPVGGEFTVRCITTLPPLPVGKISLFPGDYSSRKAAMR